MEALKEALLRAVLLLALLVRQASYVWEPALGLNKGQTSENRTKMLSLRPFILCLEGTTVAGGGMKSDVAIRELFSDWDISMSPRPEDPGILLGGRIPDIFRD